MRDPVSNFIDLVGSHFPRPKFPTEDAEAVWMASWVRTLGHYDPAALAKAADIIVRTRDRKKDGAFFPVPKDVIQACEDAKRNIAMRPLALLAGNKPPSGFSPERHKLALDLMGTDMGRQAFAGQWHGQLYAFCYANARLPSPSEVADLKANARAFDRDLAALERGEIDAGPDLDVKRLAKLGRHVAARREKIAKAIGDGS